MHTERTYEVNYYADIRKFIFAMTYMRDDPRILKEHSLIDDVTQLTNGCLSPDNVIYQYTCIIDEYTSLDGIRRIIADYSDLIIDEHQVITEADIIDIFPDLQKISEYSGIQFYDRPKIEIQCNIRKANIEPLQIFDHYFICDTLHIFLDVNEFRKLKLIGYIDYIIESYYGSTYVRLPATMLDSYRYKI